MRILFIGVGEAFDEPLPNCSLWLETFTNARRTMLLDCGFSVPFSYWRSVPEPLELDLLWISHFHGDHFFGVPALLLRFYEEGREGEFTIIGQPGVREKVEAAMDLAYPGTRLKFRYPITYQEAQQGQTISLLGLTLDFAENVHPQPCLSIKVFDGKSSLFYSGDGQPTAQGQALAKRVDLMVHESFAMEPDTPGHGTVPGSIDFAREAEAKILALVHIRRDVRRERRGDILRMAAEATDMHVMLPAAGDVVDL
jgi:ribonuclease Z